MTTVDTATRTRGWFPQLLLRLHFLAGVFIGPFILVAALSGAAYAMAPSIERVVYAHELTAPASGPALSLADQVDAAQGFVDRHHPGAVLSAVRPAPAPGDTTRVMYTEDGLLESQSRAVFVDPATADVRGDLLVYGTSGALPIRTWISTLHRSLFLGDIGRLYSETAASWLGVVVLAGFGLWVARIRTMRRRRQMVMPARGLRGYRRVWSWHAATGIWLLVGALFLSATGITWSQFGGANVDQLRAAWGWSTPSLDTALPDAAMSGASAPTSGEHAGHHGSMAPTGGAATVTPELFDRVLAAARAVNVHAAEVQVTAPTTAGQAWTVAEIKRSYPTAVSAAAVDPRDMRVVSRVDWERFSIPAKLARWGIDTHQGTMWGLPNQLLLFVTALGVAAMVVWGYVMWWQRRPIGGRVGRSPASGALARAPWWGTAAAIVVAAVLGMLLPALGVTLLLFLLVDALVVTLRRPT